MTFLFPRVIWGAWGAWKYRARRCLELEGICHGLAFLYDYSVTLRAEVDLLAAPDVLRLSPMGLSWSPTPCQVVLDTIPRHDTWDWHMNPYYWGG